MSEAGRPDTCSVAHALFLLLYLLTWLWIYSAHRDPAVTHDEIKKNNKKKKRGRGDARDGTGDMTPRGVGYIRPCVY